MISIEQKFEVLKSMGFKLIHADSYGAVLENDDNEVKCFIMHNRESIEFRKYYNWGRYMSNIYISPHLLIDDSVFSNFQFILESLQRTYERHFKLENNVPK